jgi:ParB/RepB/Spo0J family partition protein
MQFIKTSSIKPDPNQPRRTFNAEKMEALEASMKADGFRKEYPVIIDDKNIIIDGERRWRSAKKVGITEIPVEVKTNIQPWERLLYQLQSEGAELQPPERLEAWYNLYKGSKQSHEFLAKKLGTTKSVFSSSVSDYGAYLASMSVLSKGSKFPTPEPKRFWPLTIIGNEPDVKLREKLAEKAIKEDWTTDKARDIRRSIAEHPLRTKQILSQDYTDPHEGSNQWKLRLEVAESDIDIEELEEMGRNTDKMFKQVDQWDQLMRSALSLRAALQGFDYKLAPVEIRVKLHRTLTTVLPGLTDYIGELEKYMITRGELTKTGRTLKGE